MSVVLWAWPSVMLVLAHCPPLSFCAFLESIFLLYSTCIWCMFLHGDNNSSTSGNMLVVMYMCIETCSSSPFWMNVGGINVSIRSANKCLIQKLETCGLQKHDPFLSCCKL
jgi:hypothetical protein